jgi:hypothetical protein
LQHSNKPQEELGLARALVEDMRRARSLEELEGFWKRYLQHLDRVWNKAEAHYSKSPKWSGWHGKYAKARKQDQLLKYLMQSRNSDEHSIDEITEKMPGFMAINGTGPGNRLHIERMVIAGGRMTEFKASTPFLIKQAASKVRLLPVENRGVIYSPPREHLGDPIGTDDLVQMATKGIEFYAGFLFAAEEFFVTPAKSS